MILDDEEMPVNEYGEHAEMILNPLGVIGRENIAQLYEQELNFLADTCLRQTLDMDNVDEKIEHIRKFFTIVDPKDTLEVIDEFLQSATDEEKEEFLDDCYNRGLFIKQLPFFGNISMKEMIDLYGIFGYHPYTFTWDNQEIEEPLIMANMYTLRLKHDPKSKFSARASGELSINNIPSKSSSFKDHNALFSKTPVRMGEMEFVSLELMKDMDIIIKYLKQTSSNPGERAHFNEELLTRNIFDIDRIGLVGSPSITSQIIKTYFLSIGLENVDNRTFDELQKLIIKHEGDKNNES